MTVIDEFLSQYRTQYDFYDNVARLGAQIVDGNLQAAGIRSIVTSRAKSISRLEAKVNQRNKTANYATAAEIVSDIPDLAGVRVALYFPAERTEVDKIIKDSFVPIRPPKEFPTASKLSYKKRFSGYWATHYRVQLKEQSLTEIQKRYSSAQVEIQVASVLMHAWSEVEHDLVYKPLEGVLSEEEYALLDELNGLVMAGEIGLERLQKAGEARVAAADRSFLNHYDLAAHVLNRTAAKLNGPLSEAGLGRIDLLFKLLDELHLTTPRLIEPYIESLHGDTERRPIAEQIIDSLLAEDESRYKLYENLRSRSQKSPSVPAGDAAVVELDSHKAMGFFVSRWTSLERLVRELAKQTGTRSALVFPSPLAIQQLQIIPDEMKKEIERFRRLRNEVVHGIVTPNAIDLREAGNRLQQIVSELEQRARESVRP